MSKNVLITGGAGFIGLSLANRLLNDGHRVHLVDNFSRGVKDHDLENTLARENISFSSIDCRDRDAVARLPLDFDVIFHLAAIIGVVHVMQRPYEVVMDNMTLLGNLIEHAKRQQNLSRFMFASTSEIYAGTLENFHLAIPTPEDTPLSLPPVSRARTSYMLSKIAGEALCHYSGLPFTIFRPHNVYGPRMGSIHVVPGKLKDAYDATDGDTIEVPSVEQTRSFCFIDDAVEMLVRMMTRESCLGQSLNLGTQDPEITIGEVVELCFVAAGKQLTIRPAPAPPGSPTRRAPDMSRTAKLIDYTSQTSLKDGIAKTFEWYRTHVFEKKGISAQ